MSPKKSVRLTFHFSVEDFDSKFCKPVIRMVIGIRNSTKFEGINGLYSVTNARAIEWPRVNAVISPNNSFL